MEAAGCFHLVNSCHPLPANCGHGPSSHPVQCASRTHRHREASVREQTPSSLHTLVVETRPKLIPQDCYSSVTQETYSRDELYTRCLTS